MIKVLFWILLILFSQASLASERILVLAPHACEIVAAIGMEDNIVGVGEYCDFPATLNTRPHVGNHQRIFVESALRLNPDMIIVRNHQLAGLQKFREKNIPILVSNPQSLRAIMEDIGRIGDVLQQSPNAAHLVEELQSSLAILQSGKKRTRTFFFETWSRPLMTEGGESYISDSLTHLGMHNVFHHTPRESFRVSEEAVITQSPNLIIFPSKKRQLEREAYWKIRLIKKPQFIYVDPDLISRPGPRLMDALNHIHNVLHP